ncbi:MAG: cytoskeletal protein CcmA (bactofilin family) [Saprospiraceae bacterium]|jgi:cytoskeletal protein CcmA (bactofilin family)
MFKNNNSMGQSGTGLVDTNSIDRIAEGSVLEGNINSTNGIRIDGTVKGSVKCEGKVVVGVGGIVEGEIICLSADIEGTLKSSIEVKDILELKATSNLQGEITTGKLSIEPGATFTGTCKMGGVVKGISKEESTSQIQQEKTA